MFTESDIIKKRYLKAIAPYLIQQGDCLINTKATRSKPYGYVFLKTIGKKQINILGNRLTYYYHNNITNIYLDLQVLHTCDNPACCNPKHLYLGTNEDNMLDKRIRKRVVGEKNPCSKLTEKQVLEIYLKTKTHYNRAISYLYKVPEKTVSSIKLKQTWKHLTDAYDELMFGV